ncbi:MAG: carbamoyltransferase HypF, partial [Candidatus Thermoplasmatota archaeon]|nr:carbamoyltransferase HypF [Candidatus Thermoplasmatota archaeon]
NTKPEAIVCDLHPQFATTRLARRMSEEFSIPLKQVQHHWAHAVSLLAEHGIGECISIITDGVGYGADGHVWGGEVLYSSIDKFERIGHLQEQPMPGGDLATKWPIRIAAGMLGEEYAAEFLAENAEELPHGKTEADVIIKQITAGKLMMTTSCGRVLDAASAVLGICRQRTYEGEPAMRLESAAVGGKDALVIEPEIREGILYTSNLISAIYENRDKIAKRDLAYSVHSYLAKGLARMAAKEAEKRGFGVVGFSGGCAYNEILVSEIKRELEKQGLKLITNAKVPRGDGGIALGQALLGRFA